MKFPSSVTSHLLNYGKNWVSEMELAQDDFKVVRVPRGDRTLELTDRAILFSRPNMVYRFEPMGQQYSAIYVFLQINFSVSCQGGSCETYG